MVKARLPYPQCSVLSFRVPATSTTLDVAPHINWAKNPLWTWTLITYLTDHPDFRMKIFSNSRKAKTQQYAVLAEAIFSNEPTHADGFKANPERYATSVETRLRRLKKEYVEHLKTLRAIGADLVPDETTPNTQLANLLADIKEKWPWWSKLHGFWHELPNYNPMEFVESDYAEIDEPWDGHGIKRKRQMDYELSMAHAANKRLKNELHIKKIRLKEQLELEELRQQSKLEELRQHLKLEELRQQLKLEELRQQLKLERLRTSLAYPNLNTAPAHPLPGMFPVPIRSGSLNSETGISENTAVSFNSSTPASFSAFTSGALPKPIATVTPFDIFDLSFDIPFSSTS